MTLRSRIAIAWLYSRVSGTGQREQFFGAKRIVSANAAAALIAVGKHNQDRGVGKELQPALHDCLEHRLVSLTEARITRRISAVAVCC